jgi:hypothetical protein
MFNLFNKNNDGNKQDCYLIKSQLIDQKILDNDMNYYKEIFESEEIPLFFKDLAKNFLLPYKISFLKFSFNKEYYEDPFPLDLQNDHKHIAPSLKELKNIKENQFGIPMGYPSWFLIAFPDVALWAIKGAGLKLIENKYKNLTDEELNDGRYIRAELLNDIIKMYQSVTKKALECKNY